jgi:hypothetical protein
MKSQKEEVLALLADSSMKENLLYNELFAIFSKAPGRLISQMTHLNRVGFSKSSLETVKYELRKLYSISEIEIKKAKPVTVKVENVFKEKIEASFDAEIYVIEPIILKQDNEALAETLKAFEGAPDDVKEAIKFRDEFPFLNNVETPTELKALVTDKFTHYNEFCDAHKELIDRVVLPLIEGKEHFEAQTISNEVIFEIAKKAVQNFTMEQTIYDELVSYRDNGKVLGIHPVFFKNRVKNEVDEMSIADASKRQTLLENYIRRDIKNVETAKNDKDKEKYQQKVDSWKEEKELIKAKLDAAGK